MPTRKTALLSLYIGIFLMSTTGLFAKSIALDATSITQLRSVAAAVALAAFCGWRADAIRLGSLKEALGVYGLGLCMGIHWVTYFQAMQVSTVAIGMLSLFSYPVITVLIEPLFHGAAPRLKDMIAAVILFAGVIIMTLDGLNHPTNAALQGALWGLVSAFFFSIRNILQKYRFSHIPSGTLMFHQVTIVALALLFFIDFPKVAELSMNNWLLIIALGLLCSAGAHTLLALSLKGLPAKSVALISCLQPVIGSSLAWAILRESISLPVLIGGSIVISVAAFESYWQARKANIVDISN